MEDEYQDRNIALLLFVNKLVSIIKCLDFKYYKGRIHHLDKNEYSRIVVVGILSAFELFLLVCACREHYIFKSCESLTLICYPLLFYLNFMSQEKRKIRFLKNFIRHLEDCQKISLKVYPFNCHLLISVLFKICTSIIYLNFARVVQCCDMFINATHQLIINILVLPGMIKLGGICLVLFYFEVQYSGLNESFEDLLVEVNSNKMDCIPTYGPEIQVDENVVELLRVARRLRRTFKLLVRFNELNESYLSLYLFQAYVFLFDLYFRYCYREKYTPTAFFICCYYLFSYVDFGVMAYYWKRLEVTFKKTQVLAMALAAKHKGELDIEMDMLLHHALIIQPKMANFGHLFYFYLITCLYVILMIHIV